MAHGIPRNPRATMTASDRIRLARIRREAERAERIGSQRETQGFARMMRENRGCR